MKSYPGRSLLLMSGWSGRMPVSTTATVTSCPVDWDQALVALMLCSSLLTPHW